MNKSKILNQGKQRWWMLGALSLALLAGGLDMTVLNLALPTLAVALHASSADLQWIVDSYNLVVAAMLLPAGLMGDRFGRKKMLMVSLVIFGLASIACAYSTNANELILARALLGLGSAFIFPLALSVLPVFFSEEERSKATAILMGTTVVAYPIGPILGGWLLTKYAWSLVFLINVPVTIIAFIAVFFLMVESKNEDKPGLDFLGILLSSSSLATLTYSVIKSGEKGWLDSETLFPMIFGFVSLTAFLLWEKRVARISKIAPLVDLSLFSTANFSWGTILSTVSSFAMFGFLFTVPQFFQAIKGYDAMETGFRLLPMIGGLVAGAAMATKLMPADSAKYKIAIGFTLLAAGLITGAQTQVESGDWFTNSWITLTGIGVGFVLPATMDAALSALSPEHSGVGSALIQAFRQVGGTFGVAFLGSILNSIYRSNLNISNLSPEISPEISWIIEKGVSAGLAVTHKLGMNELSLNIQNAFVHGMSMMMIVCSIIALAGAGLALIFLPRMSKPVIPDVEQAQNTFTG